MPCRNDPEPSLCLLDRRFSRNGDVRRTDCPRGDTDECCTNGPGSSSSTSGHIDSDLALCEPSFHDPRPPHDESRDPPAVVMVSRPPARGLWKCISGMSSIASFPVANAALASKSPRSFAVCFLRLRYQHTPQIVMQSIAAIAIPTVVHATLPISTPPASDASAAAPPTTSIGGSPSTSGISPD